MANVIVTTPAEYYPNPNKDKPLFNGQMYIGEPDLDPADIPLNQKQVQARQENGSLVNISQPIAISAGGVPVDASGDVYIQLIVDGAYSQLVNDNLGAQQYYVPNKTNGEPLTEQSDNVVLAADTVADMKTKDLQPGQFIRTKGYHAAGDGGDATYLIKTAAEFGGTPDEFGDHTLANGNIAVLQIKSGEVDVKQYGFIGDAVTNNQPQFQSLVSRAQLEGLTIIVSPGDHNLTTLDTASGCISLFAESPRNRIRLKGTQKERCIIRNSTDQYVFDFFNSDLTVYDDVQMENLTFIGDGSASTPKWMNSRGMQEAYFHNIDILGMTECFRGERFFTNVFKQVLFSENGNGTRVILGDQCNKVDFEQCFFNIGESNPTGVNVLIQGDGVLTNFVGCIFQYGRGIQVTSNVAAPYQATNLNVIGTSFEFMDQECVRVSPGSGEFYGLTIRDSYLIGDLVEPVNPIEIDNVVGAVIEGNTFIRYSGEPLRILNNCSNITARSNGWDNRATVDFTNKPRTENSASGDMIPDSFKTTFAWNPGAPASGADVSTDVSVPGVLLGDQVTVRTDIDSQDLQLTAYVSAADTVTLLYQNNTGGIVDLPNSNYYINVNPLDF